MNIYSNFIQFEIIIIKPYGGNMEKNKLIIGFGFSKQELSQNHGSKNTNLIVVEHDQVKFYEDVPIAIDFAINQQKRYENYQAELVFNIEGIPSNIASTLKTMIIQEFNKFLDDKYSMATAV